jgi:hypothetical protein
MCPERAADFKWFDLGTLSEDREFSHEEIIALVLQPLPFDKCAIAGIDPDNFVFVVLVTKGTGDEFGDAILIEPKVQQAPLDKKGYAFPAFWVRPSLSDAQGMDLRFVEPKYNQDDEAIGASRISAMVLALLMEIVHKENTEYKAYTAKPKSNNAKRIRQGKKPMFDWHTVVIEPPRQKLPDQGGTHASPRLHDVRGHWVTRGGKKYWRKAHQRGDASKGVVFHDYKLKGETDDCVA